MKITFCHRIYESPAIEYISAVLKKNGHEVSMVFDSGIFDDFFLQIPRLRKKFFNEEAYLQKVADTAPDLICFSLMSDDFAWASGIAGKIKQRLDVPILAGGILATIAPEYLLREGSMDYVCVGEGVEAAVELCDALSAGKQPGDIRNIWHRNGNNITKTDVRPLMEDLDSVPFPDKEIFYSAAPYLKRQYFTMTSFGCVFSCTYCANNTMRNLYKHYKLRRRSVDNVLEELKEANEKYSPDYIYFYDDLFTSNKKWLRTFLPLYKKEIGLPYYCINHVSFLDEEVISLLAESGCRMSDMGIESANPEIRKNVLNRKEKNDKYIEVARLCRKYGVKLKVDVLFGIPFETKQDYVKCAELINEIRPMSVSTFPLTYYQGLEIYQSALKEGKASGKFIKAYEESRNPCAFGETGLSPEDYGIFEFFFNVICILPKRVNSFILKHRLYEKFKYLPPALGVYIDYAYEFFLWFLGRNLKVDKHFYRYTHELWARLRGARKPLTKGKF